MENRKGTIILYTLPVSRREARLVKEEFVRNTINYILLSVRIPEKTLQVYASYDP